MNEEELRHLLGSGDRRSIGDVGGIVPRIKSSPSLVNALVRLMCDADPVVSMRAADALEKASRDDPHILAPHKRELLGTIGKNPQQEVRWHLLQILPRLRLTRAEQTQAFEIATLSLRHHSRIVVADALSAMFKLSVGDAVQTQRAKSEAERLRSSSSAAVRSRAKRLLADV
jgi:hypothetical protein